MGKVSTSRGAKPFYSFPRRPANTSVGGRGWGVGGREGKRRAILSAPPDPPNALFLLPFLLTPLPPYSRCVLHATRPLFLPPAAAAPPPLQASSYLCNTAPDHLAASRMTPSPFHPKQLLYNSYYQLDKLLSPPLRSTSPSPTLRTAAWRGGSMTRTRRQVRHRERQTSQTNLYHPSFDPLDISHRRRYTLPISIRCDPVLPPPLLPLSPSSPPSPPTPTSQAPPLPHPAVPARIGRYRRGRGRL